MGIQVLSELFSELCDALTDKRTPEQKAADAARIKREDTIFVAKVALALTIVGGAGAYGLMRLGAVVFNDKPAAIEQAVPAPQAPAQMPRP